MSMPRDVNRGVNSVKRFVRQANIQGVHGTLIELIDCIPQLHTAVEVGSLSPYYLSRPAELSYPLKTLLFGDVTGPSSNALWQYCQFMAYHKVGSTRQSQSVSQITSLPFTRADHMLPTVITQHIMHNHGLYPERRSAGTACHVQSQTSM